MKYKTYNVYLIIQLIYKKSYGKNAVLYQTSIIESSSIIVLFLIYWTSYQKEQTYVYRYTHKDIKYLCSV